MAHQYFNLANVPRPSLLPPLAQLYSADTLPVATDLSMYATIRDQGQEGACFPAGTRVVMGDLSTRPIEQISVGETVTTASGAHKRVVKVYRREFAGEMLLLQVRGRTQPIACTPEHPFLVDEEWRTANDLAPGMVLQAPVLAQAIRQPWADVRDLLEDECTTWSVQAAGGASVSKTLVYGSPEGSAIPTTLHFTPDVLRFLGLFLAEGAYRKSSSGQIIGIQFSLNAEMVELRDFVCRVAESAFGLTAVVHYGKAVEHHVIEVHIGSATLGRTVRQLCGELAYGKVLSPILLQLPPTLQIHLLRGWLHGDGNYTSLVMRRKLSPSGSARAQIEGVSSSRDLIDGMYRVALRCGLSPSISARKAKGAHRDSWSLYFYGEDAQRLFTDVAFGPTSSAKRVVAVTNGAQRLKIRSVDRRLTRESVYNLEVEDEHTYLAEGIAVHNCTGFGETQAYEIARRAHGFPHPEYIFSPQFLYYLEGKVEGHPGADDGAVPSDGLTIMEHIGVCNESYDRYIAGQIQPPSPEAMAAAARFKIQSWANVTRINNMGLSPLQGILPVLQLLAARRPVVMAIAVHESFEVATGGRIPMPGPQAQDPVLGGHAICAVGFDYDPSGLGGGWVKFANSWGAGWGENGFGYLPFTYVYNLFLTPGLWSISLPPLTAEVA